MLYQPTDPPMKPSRSAAVWFESAPESIQDDLQLATLVVRIGMASNALNAQMRAAVAARRRPAAMRTRDILSSLVTSAALTYEATRLAKKGMPSLRTLARRAPSSDEKRAEVELLLQEVGRLCGGKHPAFAILERARNGLAFHWDSALIELSVREYGKNQTVVWLESDVRSNPVHRLAVDVLAHALVPAAWNQSEKATAKRTINDALAQVDEAMRLIVHLFTACIYGYLKTCNAVRKKRTRTPRGARSPQQPRSSSKKRRME